MKRKPLAAFVAALTLCATAGCGTVSNLTHTEKAPLPSLYGGVFMDTDKADKCAAIDGDQERQCPPSQILEVVQAACLLIDLPLSAVGDTFTLPYVLWLNPEARYPSRYMSDFTPSRLITSVEKADKPTP